MKIARKGAPPVIIGKRIVLGQMIQGCVTMGAFVWDGFYPENALPAGTVMALTQTITGLAQVAWVNRYGVTTRDGTLR